MCTVYRLKRATNFAHEFTALIEAVEVHFQWRPQTPDPNDEMVLETTINGRADSVVTFNVADAILALPAARIRLLFWFFVVAFNLVGATDILVDYHHAEQFVPRWQDS